MPFAIALEIGCGVLILLGYYTRPAALLLAGFCLATAVLFHIKLGNRNELLHFEKDLAIAGGLLVLFAHGAGRWALDAQPWRSSQSDAAALRAHAPRCSAQPALIKAIIRNTAAANLLKIQVFRGRTFRSRKATNP
jgi:hypothetical protein